MALHWDLSAVENGDELCWIEATEDNPNHGIEAGKSYLNPITNALIWSTIAVDLPGPTAENVGEFYARLRLTERVFGPFLIRAEVDGKRPEGEAAMITIDEVIAHIGLSCNVSTKSRAQWLKRLGSEMDDMSRRAEMRLAAPLKEAVAEVAADIKAEIV